MCACSSPWDIDWESYRASVDVLQPKDIFTAAPATVPSSKEMQLPCICTASGVIADHIKPARVLTASKWMHMTPRGGHFRHHNTSLSRLQDPDAGPLCRGFGRAPTGLLLQRECLAVSCPCCHEREALDSR